METAKTITEIEALIEARQIPQAYKALESYLRDNAQSSKGLYLKGLCEHKSGHQQRALQSLLSARVTAPPDIAVLSLLAKTYMALPDLPQALLVLQEAQKILQNQMLSKIESEGEAQRAYKEIYVDLATIYHHQNKAYQAVMALKEAEQLFPDDAHFTFLRGHLATQHVPLWHVPMLGHRQRNEVYEKAIKARVKQGDIVLDVGTGSGLLAMMAIRAGAAHVYACESNGLMAEMAKDIVAKNGYEKHITIIEKHSSQLVIGKDMPQKADIMVTEIFDNAIVGEGALPSIHHARIHLLKPQARMIPERASLHGAIISSPHFESYHKIGDVCGFDLSPMNALSHSMGYKDVNFDFTNAKDEQILSENFMLHDWDFTKAPEMSFSKMIEVDAVNEGVANGLLMWFELHLTGDIIFTTKTPHPQDHWREVCQILLETKNVKKGAPLKLDARYERYFEFSLSTG